MKLRRSIIPILSIIFLSVIQILVPICTAQEAIITIKNVNVQLIETRGPIGNRTIYIYNISAVLQNSGDVISDEITVYLHDPEYNTTIPSIKLTPSNISLNPGEMKVFSLNRWPTTLSGDIPINISFRPSAPDVLETDNNHGYYVYTLHIGDGDTTSSTPGFEVLIVLLALCVLLLKKHMKK